MLKKFLNGTSQTITGAAVIIGATSLASRFLGILRDRVLAGEFGAGNTLDAYYAAFRIPDTIFNLLILGALSAGFIPVFSELFSGQKDRAWRLANNTLNTLIILLTGFGLVMFFLAPQIMKFLTPGFDGEKMALTISLTRVMFLSPLLLGVSSLFGGILQSTKRFLIYSLAPIFYNLGIIIGALFFVKRFGAIGLAYGVVLGATLHLLVQLPSAVSIGYRYKLAINWLENDFKEVVRLMFPRMLSLSVSQINLTIITVVASGLATGSLSIFNLSNNLQSFPLGLFGISFAIAAFPTLCDLARRETKEEFIKSFSNTARQILFFIIPTTVLFIILRAQIVRVVLGAGKFDWASTITAADVLAVFSISLFAQTLIPLLNRSFFALKNSATPFISGLISEGLMIFMAITLTKPVSIFGTTYDFGVLGLALAFTIASILNFTILWILLRIKLGSLNEKRVFVSAGKITFASVIMGFVVQFMKFGVEPFFGTETFVGIFLQGLISGLVGIAVFAIVGMLINMEELNTLFSTLKRHIFRNKPTVTEEEGIDVAVD